MWGHVLVCGVGCSLVVFAPMGVGRCVMGSSMVVTPGRSVKRVVVQGGRSVVVPVVRTFLWDNPELRRAFREAMVKEGARVGARVRKV